MVYTTTKEVIKAFRLNQETKLQNKLFAPGSFLTQHFQIWLIAISRNYDQ